MALRGYKTVAHDMQHEAFRQDLLALLSRHGEELQPIELLAVAASLVGQILAFQDPTCVTEDEAMVVITFNIQAGNRSVIEAETLAKASRPN